MQRAITLHRALAAAAILVLACLTPRLYAEPCEPGWAETFASWGTTNQVHAQAVFDDGTGPALYAGGEFTTAGGVPSEYIAKWTACPPDPSCNLADLLAFITAFGAGCP